MRKHSALIFLFLIVVLYAGTAHAETYINNLKNMGTYDDIRDIEYLNNQFIVVGYKGLILTSQDGSIWKAQKSNTSEDLECIIWDGRKYIATGSGYILTSPDGKTWNVKKTKYYLYSIAYNGSIYAATDGGILTSTDLVNWTRRVSETKQSTGSTSSTQDITWTGKKFVTTGSNGAVYSSADGLKWTLGSGILDYAFCYHAEAGKDTVVITTNYGLFISPVSDCVKWEMVGIINNPQAIYWTNEKFILFATAPANSFEFSLAPITFIMWSVDGRQWKEEVLYNYEAFLFHPYAASDGKTLVLSKSNFFTGKTGFYSNLYTAKFGVSKFSDITGSEWYFEDLSRLCAHGALNGYADGTFKPQQYMTKAEFLKVLLLSKSHEVKPAKSTIAWYIPYIDEAKRLGILTGLNDPDTHIKRKEIAEWICRANYYEPVSSNEKVFADTAGMDTGWIDAAYKAGFIKGYEEDGKLLFKPESNASRAEIAAILSRFTIPQ